MVERVKTGIPGLDELINGGIPSGSTILLSGTSGAGKTIFCSQFIYNGAKSFNEPGVYLSVEEPIENIRRNMKLFGIDFEPLEKKGKIKLVTFDPLAEDLIETLRSAISSINAKRVCVDSLVGWSLVLEKPRDIRRGLINLRMTLKSFNCTSILTTEIPAGDTGISRFKVEEFIVDGVIVLNYIKRDRVFERSVMIWKMRGTSHSKKIHPFEITEKGIVIYPEEEVI